MDREALEAIAAILLHIHMNTENNNIRAISVKYILNNEEDVIGLEAGCPECIAEIHEHDKKFEYARVLLVHRGTKH